MDFARLPGVYRQDRTPAPQGAVRLDVCAFAGVAPRGPARVPVVDARRPLAPGMVLPDRPRLRTVPVAIEGLDEYRRVFGPPGEGGYLGRAVEAFFAQGGRRCLVMRIVHRDDAADALAPFARCAVGDAQRVLRRAGGAMGVRFVARDEGAWGDALRAELGWEARAAVLSPEPTGLYVADPAALPVGTRLRLTAVGAVPVLATVTAVEAVRATDSARTRHRVSLDAAPPFLFDATLRVESLDFFIELSDADGNRERHERLAPDPRHPRYAGLVLCRDSRLVWPDASWAESGLDAPTAGASLLAMREVVPFFGGADAYADVEPADFLDETTLADFTAGDGEALDDDAPSAEGLCALRGIDEAALLCVPDLYHPPFGAPEEPPEPPQPLVGAEFADCAALPPVSLGAAAAVCPKLVLDPRKSAELAEIVRLQDNLVRLVSARARTAPLLVLLDVPPGLSLQAVGRWRRAFDTPEAAAYTPWVRVAPTEPGGRLRLVPPSACAAGIVAATERALGVAQGPANAVIARAVQCETTLSPTHADALHADQINVITSARAGLTLTGARTLSQDLDWRSVAVRRVFHWILRYLQRESPWLVFEGATPQLAEDVEIWLVQVLRRLWQAGWLSGATEREAFFVAVSRDLRDLDAGRLRIDLGFAPAEPLEYLIVRLSLSAEGLEVLAAGGDGAFSQAALPTLAAPRGEVV